MMRLNLTPEMAAARPLIETLEAEGFEAVFVGGAVRDAVLGLPVHDIDIATSALPEQVLSLFPKCIPTGLQHGTVTVVHEGTTYEVTTYRTESQYEQFRKPSSVSFVLQLDEDLLRRDFTMNAMAIRQGGELYDPYDGLTDLRESRLRCVGDANERFQEDALRILRAVRFLGTYGLKPVPSLWRGLIAHKKLLRHIAMERVQAEMDKMLSGQVPERSLAWLASSQLWLEWKEPLQASLAERVHELAKRDCGMASLSELTHLDERWAAILLSMHAVKEDTRALLAALRFSNKRIDLIVSILQVHTAMRAQLNGSEESNIRIAWLDCVIRYGESVALHWLRVAQALKPHAGPISNQRSHQLLSIMEDMPVKTLKQLALSGSELQRALARKSGPWISLMLKRLLFVVAAGELANEPDKLIAQSKLWNDEGMNDES